MEPQTTESPAGNQGSAKDEKQLTATDVQAALKQVFKPSKRNIGIATMLGTALILIQCARAGYLPEFDWSSGAGAVVLIAVLAVSLFAMVALAVLVAIPALPVATEKKSVRKPYLCAIASVLAFLVGMVLLGHLLAALKFTGEWSNSLWFAVIILGLIFGVPALAAYNAARKQPKVTKKGVKATMLESWWNNFTGLVVLPAVYGVVYLLLARYQDSDAFSVVFYALVPVVPIAAVIALVLFRPRNPLMYQAVGLGLFALFCGPASTGAFSLLGLGGRTVEFSLEKPEYAAELERGNMMPVAVTKSGPLYQVYLRLRLGSEIAVSADDNELGRAANVVAIPRNAIRGLRFVPPPKRNESKPSVAEARNPNHLIAASRQWALRQAAERFLAAREEKWKADQKAGLSAAQADWLKWARETAKELAPFADGYPVLADANQVACPSSDPVKTARSTDAPAAASPKP